MPTKSYRGYNIIYGSQYATGYHSKTGKKVTAVCRGARRVRDCEDAIDRVLQKAASTARERRRSRGQQKKKEPRNELGLTFTQYMGKVNKALQAYLLSIPQTPAQQKVSRGFTYKDLPFDMDWRTEWGWDTDPQELVDTMGWSRLSWVEATAGIHPDQGWR